MSDEVDRAQSEHILNLKDIVLEHWRQLPAEHQVSIGLVLVSQIMDTEWGTWFKEALSLRFGSEFFQEAPAEGRGVLRLVTRDDLKDVGFSSPEIGQLTDDDLSAIAKMITEHWTTDVFRDDLLVITEMLLAHKQKP